MLGGACGVMAVLLHRSRAEQARLAALVLRREGELAKLVSLAACLPGGALGRSVPARAAQGAG